MKILNDGYCYCPNCGIGLNEREINMGFCQNCKAHWEPDIMEEYEAEDFNED